MKLKTFILVAALSASSLGGCAQRPGPLGEKTIKLDNFDFSTPITDIFPERYIDPQWGANWYKIPSINGTVSYCKSVCEDSDDNEVWITYSHSSCCTADEFLSMYGYTFCSAYLVTTLDGHIFAVGGHAHEITQEDRNKFIDLLSKQYGEPEHSTGSFSSSLYKWKQKDRTLTLAVKETDEHNVLKIERNYNEEDDTIEFREGKRRNRVECYFFIFEGEWYDRFVNTYSDASGNILYCK